MINKANQKHLLWFIFMVYIVALLIFIPKHEHWADEAQSWLLARDSSFYELFFKYLRYEGSPGLWHLVLWIPSRILSYSALSYISGIIASVGIYLLLFKSPFPIWIKIILPFSYFLFFQYAIVARSYVLLIPLLFGIATIYQKKFDRPFLFVILVILLANVSMHGCFLAIIILLDSFIDLLVAWKDLNKRRLITQSLSYLLFGASMYFIYIQLKPPGNLSFSTEGFTFRWPHFKELSQEVLIAVFSEKAWLSYPILILSIIWFSLTKRFLLFFLGSISLLVLFSIYYNVWHQGTIFLFWIFVLWISLENKPRFEFAANLKNPLLLSIVIILFIHVYWNAVAVKNDFKGHYSASESVANFIKENNYEGKSIHAYHFWSVSIQPYFKENVYTASRYFENKAFWRWTIGNEYPDPFEEVLKRNHDMITFSKPHLYPVPELVEGYSQVDQSFIGEVYWKNRIQEYVEFVVWVKE